MIPGSIEGKLYRMEQITSQWLFLLFGIKNKLFPDTCKIKIQSTYTGCRDELSKRPISLIITRLS